MTINEENLSKLSAIRNEVATEIEKSCGSAVSQFVKENFIKLLSSSSNFEELKERG
jgi:hypothetical protein